MTMSIGWKIDKRKLAQQAVRSAAASGVGKFAEAMLTDANETVPLEEGTLERSGDTDLDREKIKASVFYDTPYAVVQHEDTTLSHDSGRKAKWLESTLKNRGREMGPFVAGEIKRALP